MTGASGFAGSHLLERLPAGDVHAWTRSSTPPSAHRTAAWHTVDLLDRAAVIDAIDAIKPAAVFHCAGSPHVAESWRDTAAPFAHNVLGTHHLLDALRRTRRACRVLVVGSASVYASSPTPIDEEDRVAPGSPYALSKFAQERLALRAIVEDGVEVVATRSFNHTGPRQTAAFVAPSMARQIALIEQGRLAPVLKVGNLDASRDFTDVRDVADAYLALMAAGDSGAVYNVASGTGHTMRQVLDALLRRSTRTIAVENDPTRMRPNDTPVLVGNAARLRLRTGWAPAIPFDRMIDDLLAYWRTRIAAGRE